MRSLVLSIDLRVHHGYQIQVVVKRSQRYVRDTNTYSFILVVPLIIYQENRRVLEN